MVTKTAPYSKDMLLSMVEDNRALTTDEEARLLEKFVNRKLFEGWYWNRLRDTDRFSLWGSLYRGSDFWFSLTRGLFSLVPLPLLRLHLFLVSHVRFRSLLPFFRERR